MVVYGKAAARKDIGFKSHRWDFFGILNYVCDIVVKRFTFAISRQSSPDERLLFVVFSSCFVYVPCARLSCPFRQLLSACINISYRIASGL